MYKKNVDFLKGYNFLSKQIKKFNLPIRETLTALNRPLIQK